MSCGNAAGCARCELRDLRDHARACEAALASRDDDVKILEGLVAALRARAKCDAARLADAAVHREKFIRRIHELEAEIERLHAECHRLEQLAPRPGHLATYRSARHVTLSFPGGHGRYQVDSPDSVEIQF